MSYGVKSAFKVEFLYTEGVGVMFLENFSICLPIYKVVEYSNPEERNTNL